MTKHNTSTDTKAAFVDAIKEANRLRAELMERGDWTREEMEAANLRIRVAMNNLRACCK